VSTAVGYCGGTSSNPDYQNIGDHSETVRIIYDPSKITYEKLLQVFWSAHNAREPMLMRQYRSAVFYLNQDQRNSAIKIMDSLEQMLRITFFTDVEANIGFYLAEDYHQKYYLRNDPLLKAEYLAIYPDLNDFVASTATARVNGYLGGHGILERFQAELFDYGLSDSARAHLSGIVTKVSSGN
jgi:peptide-methionine (S)-S-oxide reductase